ncbi:hypothetical protein AB3662_00985 [Sorangium cellulosum]|uniref:hypothetical protein n=1 Tax=Sorangium cellulosum TaxID=56 RepID=UPI003D9A2DC4
MLPVRHVPGHDPPARQRLGLVLGLVLRLELDLLVVVLVLLALVLLVLLLVVLEQRLRRRWRLVRGRRGELELVGGTSMKQRKCLS